MVDHQSVHHFPPKKKRKKEKRLIAGGRASSLVCALRDQRAVKVLVEVRAGVGNPSPPPRAEEEEEAAPSVLRDLLVLHLVVAGLEGGEHDPVLSVLNAGVHQVLDEADL